MIYPENETYEDYENYIADVMYEDYMMRGGYKIVKREIINIYDTELTTKELDKLQDYVWQGELLIPLEMLEGE